MSDFSHEEQLVARAKKDKKAFSQLYVLYKDKIYMFINKKVGNSEISEDLTSEVFEKALNKLTSFQWLGVSFGSWLYRIARNTVFDYYRSTKRKSLRVEDEDIIEDKNLTDNEAVALHDERELDLFSAISRFSHSDQYLVYCKYFENFSNKEIAKLLQMSEVNVATRLHRLRSRLKKRLEEME